MKKILPILVLLFSLCFSQSETEEMQKFCENGDANICYALGKMNERSGALKQNKNTPESRMYYKKAAAIYQKECDVESNFVSCTVLGNMYINDQGVGSDHFKAKDYFVKACENEEYEGCVGLGKLHLSGISARKDANMAKKYFSDACDKKNQNGCLFLAQMYEKGEGISKNKKQAKEYYGKACDYNSRIGCAKYAEFK